MRKTKKLRIALTTLDRLGHRGRPFKSNAQAYEALNRRGYHWNGEDWTESDQSTSIFAKNDGKATGVIKLRLMAHPGDMSKLIRTTQAAFNVTSVSDAYPNRRGAGVRVYVEAVLE